MYSPINIFYFECKLKYMMNLVDRLFFLLCDIFLTLLLNDLDYQYLGAFSKISH